MVIESWVQSRSIITDGMSIVSNRSSDIINVDVAVFLIARSSLKFLALESSNSPHRRASFFQLLRPKPQNYNITLSKRLADTSVGPTRFFRSMVRPFSKSHHTHWCCMDWRTFSMQRQCNACLQGSGKNFGNSL